MMFVYLMKSLLKFNVVNVLKENFTKPNQTIFQNLEIKVYLHDNSYQTDTLQRPKDIYSYVGFRR